MSKYIHQQLFADLLKASERAEEKYRLFLLNNFNVNEKQDLVTMLKHIFSTWRLGSNSIYFKEYKQLNQILQTQITEQLIDNVQKVLLQKYGTGGRYDRTAAALARILKNSTKLNSSASLSANEIQELQDAIGQDTGYILSNYKEWSFLIRGNEEIDRKHGGNYGQQSFFRAKLTDVDNTKMDFIITTEGIKKQEYSTDKDNNILRYISNGVPLEYKNTIYPMFHLVEKRQKEEIVSPIIKHHVKTNQDVKGVQWSDVYQDVIIDLTMIAITNKLNEGFPVFVSSNVGSAGLQFLTCSQMLANLQTIEKLQNKVINKSIYTPDNWYTFTFEQVNRIIKEDNLLRNKIQHDILSIKVDNTLSEDEQRAQIDALNKEAEAMNILEKLTTRKTLTTNLFYSHRA